MGHSTEVDVWSQDTKGEEQEEKEEEEDLLTAYNK